MFSDYKIIIMSPKTNFLISMCCILVSFQVLSRGLWNNSDEGFAANFPTAPTRVNAASSQVTGYAYQSAQNFDNGGVLYAITVVPITLKIAKEKSTEFLVESNATFVKSMGQSPSEAKVKWAKFGDDRKRLNYEFDFNYSGVPLKAYGFWIIDRDRAIRVSVSYTKSLASNEIREAISFLDSFFIVSKK
jgi:hypothetical protein